MTDYTVTYTFRNGGSSVTVKAKDWNDAEAKALQALKRFELPDLKVTKIVLGTGL